MTRRCPWKKNPRPAATPPPPSSFVRGEHDFQIVGYSKAGDNYYSILSGAFHVGGHTWALDCGFAKHGAMTSIFLELLTPYITEDSVVAKAGLRIEDPLGRHPGAEWQSEGAHTFTEWSLGGSRSWKLSLPDGFHDHESLYVEDDRLTIRCTLEVLKKKEESAIDDIYKLLFLPSEPKPKSESDRRRHACMSPDVTFVVEETEIQSHRVVLAMRSPVFAAELLGDMRESTTRCVRVDDMRASTFRAMIRFIYTDELPIKASTDDSESRNQRGVCKEKCAARRRLAMARDLLVAADRYDLEKLRLMCENILCESMDVASVMPTLMAVRGRHSCRKLEASCIEYLASDAGVYAAVKETEEYKELEESCYSFVAEVMDKVHTTKLADDSVDTAKNCREPTNISASTYNASEVVRGTLKLRIPSFSSVWTSFYRKIKIGGYHWRLLVEPCYYATKEGTVDVYAQLFADPGTAGVRASLCFRIGNSASTLRRFKKKFTRQEPSYLAYSYFTATEHVAHDGSLTIQCDIVVTNKGCLDTSTTTAGVREMTLAPPPSIGRHLMELLVSEKGSDVTFLVEKKEIRAHKLVIATRSPVLYEVVNKEDHVIPVNDMKADVFEVVLHFIYTCELPPIDDKVLAADDGVRIVGDMMVAACRFRLDGMKAKCETLLAESISKENVVSMLELARHHNCLKLEDYCVQFKSLPHVAREFPWVIPNMLLRT